MITSRENATLKLVRKLLGQRKHRDETGLFAVEGEDLVDAATAAGVEPLYLLVAGDTVDETLLADVSTLPHPTRAIGVYRRADLSTEARQTCLGLWQLADPGNVGTLIRTAEAAGAGVVVCCGSSADPFGPKAVRASAGSILRLPVVVDRDAGATLDALAEAGTTRLGLAAGAPDVYDQVDLSVPVAVVLGSEAHGLPSDLSSRLDRMVSVPMAGSVESLNVATAGAIVCFESARQRRARG